MSGIRMRQAVREERMPPIPKTSPNLVDHGFMDARIKLLDVAAFLDRIQRHEQGDDFRVRALRTAIAELSSEAAGRTRRILELLSDPTGDPAQVAETQGASGAYDTTTSPKRSPQ